MIVTLRTIGDPRMSDKKMPDLTVRTDSEIDTWIRNHELKGATKEPLFLALLAERARRGQKAGHLDIERSLELLKQAAREQGCVTYGDLAKASNVDWKQARHKMNGANGHLDRIIDLCHVRGLPLLSAICVNESGRESGDLPACASSSGFFAASTSSSDRPGGAGSPARRRQRPGRPVGCGGGARRVQGRRRPGRRLIAHEGRWLGGATFVSFDTAAVDLLMRQGQDAKLLT